MTKKQWNPSWGEIADMEAKGICPSAVDSETGEYIEGESGHKWDVSAGYPIVCSECGVLKTN